MNGFSQERNGQHRLSRRRFVAASTATIAGLAGCIGGDDEQSPEEQNADGPRAPRVEDPPSMVYKPTHTNSIGMLDPVQAGDFQLLPHFTAPHRFWLVRGNELEEVEPGSNELHLMTAFWDAQTGEMLPVDAGQTMELSLNGEIVEPRFQPWPMLSQEMGFHFGDNVPFPEDGTYTVEVQMGPIDARKTGSFAGRFTEAVSTTFELEYNDEVQQQATSGVEYLDESEWGEPGAVSPMGHGGGMGEDGMDGGMMGNHPGVALRDPGAYPGQDQGVYESHDAQFVVRYLEDSPLPTEGESYLLVSPRTPYNQIPLPDMALTVEGAIEGDLVQTLDSDLGHHYGLAADLASGDSFDIVVETPPQAARHQGYETAFREMDPMTVEME